MSEGRLADMGKDLRDVQVLVLKNEDVHLHLQDDDGVFLDIASEEDGRSGEVSTESS